MKLINAYWEKKNLNVDTVEIIAENQDSIHDFVNIIEKNKTEYTVLKIPVNKKGFLPMLQKIGFTYIETNMQMSLNLKKNLDFSGFEKLIDQSTFEEISDIKWLKKKITDDLIFDTDKIALDPFFSTRTSNERYSNWISSVINTEVAKAFCVKFRDNDIGFFIVKKISDIEYDSFLAGVFKEYKNSGLGFLPILYAIKYAKDNDGLRISTGTSINNINSLKIHLSLGYEITEAFHILIKHEIK